MTEAARINPLEKAIRLGVITGIRSMSGAAILSTQLAEQQSEALQETPLKWLASPQASRVLQVMAVGEFVGDKLPFVPARTSLGPLLGRAVLGVVLGATVGRSKHESAVPYMIAGGISAVISTYVITTIRVQIGNRVPFSSFILGVAEDALVVALGADMLDKTHK